MGQYFFSSVVIAMEVWCVLYFLDTFLKKKETRRLGKLRFFLYYIVMLFPAFISNTELTNWIKLLSGFLSIFVLGMLFYQASMKHLLLFWALCYGIMLLTEWAVISIAGLFGISVILNVGEQYYILSMAVKLLEVLIVLVIRRAWRSRNEYASFNQSEWGLLVCIPIFSTIGGMAMYLFYPEDMSVKGVYSFLTLGLVCINFITIYFVQDILDKSEQLRISTLANQNAKNQIEAYHDMDAVYERQRRKMHDYKNQLMAVRDLLRSGEHEKAVRLLGQLTESISVDMSAINTNHSVVNAVLNQKFHAAKEKQISMIFQVGDVHEIPLTEEEIVILLGNLLDNAIVECEKVVKAGRDAVIHCKLVYEDENVILSVKNPVLHKVEIIDNKIQVSTKDGHGIGLKNVEAVVVKHDGSMALDCNEKEFQAVVVL